MDAGTLDLSGSTPTSGHSGAAAGRSSKARSKPLGEGRSDTPWPEAGSLGRRPWLVLGGGGLKGLAHIGAWRALVEAGIDVQGIVGTSIGALIGALVAANKTWEELYGLAEALRREDIVRVNRRVVFINGIQQLSVFRGETLHDYFDSILPAEGWDALERLLQVNAVDLAMGRTEWFGPGARMDVSLVEAVYASAALPVFYPPAQLDGSAFVDGGVEHPLALERAVELGATGLIAVDPGSGETASVPDVLKKGMLAVHDRIFGMMTWRRRQDLLDHWSGPPLLYVRPRLDEYETFDFDNTKYFVEEGYRAMRDALRAGAVGGDTRGIG